MFVWYALLALLLGCAVGAPASTGPRQFDPVVSPSTLTVATFNVGVAPGSVPLSLERVPALAAAIAATPFDVMCIQEAWLPETRAALQSALRLPSSQFVHVNTAGQNRTGRDWCRPGDIDLPLACVRSACPTAEGDALTECAKRHCMPQVFLAFGRNPGCVRCLIASVGESQRGMLQQCTRPPGASHIYGGNNGVVIASRVPLGNVEALPLPSSLSNRVALLASVQPPGWPQPVEIGCMHASASARLPPTSGFISWKAEKLAQVQAVMARLRTRAGMGPSLLLGDLNSGPKLGQLRADHESVFEAALYDGYVEATSLLGQPFCTVCADSTFRKKDETERLLDHVLYRQPRGGLRPVTATRLFDRPVVIPDGRGGAVTTHLSDHYGTSVTFVPAR